MILGYFILLAGVVASGSKVVPASDWMSQLSDELLIRDIPIIPGSHNSCTANSGNCLTRYTVYPIARQQKLRVFEQLIAGVRFLDVRIRYVGGRDVAVVVHTFDTDYVLGDLLNEIDIFLQTHKSEFVVLMLRGDWPPTRSFAPDDDTDVKSDRVGELVSLLKPSGIEWADGVTIDSAVGSVRGKAIFISDWFQYGRHNTDLLKLHGMPYLGKAEVYSVCDIWDENMNEEPAEKISRFMMSSPTFNVGKVVSLFDRLTGGSRPRVCGSLPGSLLFTGIALDRTHAFIVPPGMTSWNWNRWFLDNLKNNPKWRPQMTPPVPIGVVLIDFADSENVQTLIDVGLKMLELA